MTPRFSVVIPTRERAQTLRSSLQTCLNQDYEDFEIVVCDNFSSPATADVVDQVDSARVRYLRADRPLAMSSNWELAVSQAHGEYVTVLGDDDGLMPFALRELDRLITENDSPAAVHWTRGLYTWPNIGVAGEANFLRIPVLTGARQKDGIAAAQAVLSFAVNVDVLPMIYNSVIHRDLIEDVRKRTGRVFPTIYPDLYSGFAFAFAAGSYVSVDVPMNLAGLSGSSNGVATLMRKEGDPVATEFANLNDEFEFRAHPRVPDLPLPAAAVIDSFEHARDNLGITDPRLDYDRRAMSIRYLESMPTQDPESRERQRSSVRASLADDAELTSWFDLEAPDPPPAPMMSMRPSRLGFDGSMVAMDTTSLGVEDIAGAVHLATCILGYLSEPISWQSSEQANHLEAAVAARDQWVADLSRGMAERDRAVGERDRRIARLRQRVAAREQQIRALKEQLDSTQRSRSRRAVARSRAMVARLRRRGSGT